MSETELREQLNDLLLSPRYGVTLFAGHRDILVGVLSDFIHLHTEQATQEARIDELNHVMIEVPVPLPDEFYNYRSVRIRQLTTNPKGGVMKDE